MYKKLCATYIFIKHEKDYRLYKRSNKFLVNILLTFVLHTTSPETLFVTNHKQTKKKISFVWLDIRTACFHVFCTHDPGCRHQNNFISNLIMHMNHEWWKRIISKTLYWFKNGRFLSTSSREKSTFCRKFQKFKKLEINLAISFFLRSNYD